MSEKIQPIHTEREACVYVRQSSMQQVRTQLEGQRRQYELRERAQALGFQRVVVIDEDLGRSGTGSVERPGFGRLLTAVCSGSVGAVLALKASHGFNTPPGEWRLNRKLAGGGQLLDVGIYSLNACRFLLGEEPSRVSAFSSVVDHDGRFDQVEETIA